MRRTRLLKKGVGKGQEYNTRKCSGVHLDKKSVHLDRYDGVDLHVIIPAELHERLINFIMRQHGGKIPKGAKSAIVAALLTLALDQVEHTHESTRRPLVLTRSKLWKDMEICDQIMLELARMGLQVGQEVHFRVLAAAIKNVRGFDPRTIKRWRERLRELGYIRPSKKPNFWIILSIPGEEDGTEA